MRCRDWSTRVSIAESVAKRIAKLANLVGLVVGEVPALKLAILHEGLEQPLDIMLHEDGMTRRRGFWRTKRRNPIGPLIVTRRHISSLSAAISNGSLRFASMKREGNTCEA